MKKLLTLLVMFAGVFAYAEAPFGVVRGFDEGEHYRDYAVYKMLHGRPIFYYIMEDTENRPPKAPDAVSSVSEGRVVIHADAKSAVQSVFEEWLASVRYFIKKDGREEEFADLMPILEKEVQLRKVARKENADIVFHFTSKEQVKSVCGERATGCFSPKKFEIVVPHTEYVCADRKEDGTCVTVHAILLHEVGHFMALSDVYYNARYDNKKHLKTPWRLDMPDTLMNCATKIGCDDVDGFIFLLDETFALDHKGVYPERSQQGWQSFCDKTTFSQGSVTYRDRDGYNADKYDW